MFTIPSHGTEPRRGGKSCEPQTIVSLSKVCRAILAGAAVTYPSLSGHRIRQVPASLLGLGLGRANACFLAATKPRGVPVKDAAQGGMSNFSVTGMPREGSEATFHLTYLFLLFPYVSFTPTSSQ